MTEEFAGYWEDFELGKTYPTTTRRITEQDHAEFCRVVGYDVPIFVDEDYAKSTALGGRICPSHLIMSFATAMTGRLFSGTVIGLVGLERGRFVAMVRPGDSIRTEVEVLEKRPTSNPDRGIVRFRDHVLNARDELVMEVDKIVLLKRRLGK
jgi:3-hydroxybutyryl-CoA dehydratase